MDDSHTPPLHPMEREQLQAEPTLVVTVKSPREFHDDVEQAIDRLDRGVCTDDPPTLSFSSYDHLMETLTPRTLELIEAVQQECPASINETARVVDRDVKNVHEELTRLAQLGIVYFEEDGQRKRPVVWFEELVISLPFGSDAGNTKAPA